MKKCSASMTAKEYLSEAYSIKIRINTLREQLEFLKSAAEYTSPICSGSEKSITHNVRKNEDVILRILEKDDQISTEERKLSVIIGMIDRITDPIKQAIIVKRYLFGKTWGVISKEVFISSRHVQRLHDECLEELK